MDAFVLMAVVLVAIVLWLVLDKDDVWFFESPVIPAINVSFGGVLVAGTFYVALQMVLRAWHARSLRWSHRRRRCFIMAFSILMIQFTNSSLFLAQSAYALHSRCDISRKFQMAAGALQWTLWNALFTMGWIDVQAVHPISTAKVLRAHRPSREDAMVLDLPMYVHITKLPLTVALQITIVAFAVVGNAAFKRELSNAAARVPPGQVATCEELLGSCRNRWDFILVECLSAAIMMVLIFAYVGSLYRGRLFLSSQPYTKYRQANIFLRLQKRLRFPASITMIACIAVYSFSRVHLCKSSYISALGYLPMHVVNSAVCSIFAVLAMPVSKANRGLLEVWLQEFAWTEADVPTKRAERVSTIPKTELGRELLERSIDEPIWCMETTIRASYWSMLVYEYADPAVDAPMTKLDHAMAVSHAHGCKLIWELDSDTKCVCAWGDSGIVLAFRGTASVTNMVTDIKVWRTSWPKGAAGSDSYLDLATNAVTDPVALIAGGHPMVHSGFAEAWAGKGVDHKVLDLVRKLVDQLAPMFAESDVENDDGGGGGDEDEDLDEDLDEDDEGAEGDADPPADPAATADALERGKQTRHARTPSGIEARRAARAWRRARNRAEVLYDTPTGARRGRVPILVTGHSLGGAIATLCAVDIAYRLPELADKIDLHCYTFGCPRTGNRAFARLQSRLVPATWHVINSDDAVVQSGKFYGMYKRGGHRVLINVKGDLIVRPSYLEHFALRSPGPGSVPDHFLTAYWRSTMAVILVQFGSKGMEGGRESAAALMRDTGLAILFEGIGIDDEVVEALQRRYAARAEIAQGGYTIIAAYTMLFTGLLRSLTAPFAMIVGRGAGGRRYGESASSGLGKSAKAAAAQTLTRADDIANRLERFSTSLIQPSLAKKKSAGRKSKSLFGMRRSKANEGASEASEEAAPDVTPSPGTGELRFVESAGDVEAAGPTLQSVDAPAAPPPLSPLAASPQFPKAAEEPAAAPAPVAERREGLLRRVLTRHTECAVASRVDPRVAAIDAAKRGEVVGGFPGLPPVAYVEDGFLIHEYNNVETTNLVIGAAMRRAARRRGYLSRSTSSSSGVSKHHVGVELLYVGGEEKRPHRTVHVDEERAKEIAKGMLAAGGGSAEAPATGQGIVVIAPPGTSAVVEGTEGASPRSPRARIRIELPRDDPGQDDENTP